MSMLRQEAEAVAEAESMPRTLDARVVWHWRGSFLLSAAVLIGGVLLLDRLLGGYVPAAAVPLLAALVLATAWVWPPLLYRSWTYQVRAHQLWAERGVLSRTTSVVPYARVQHVDTREDLVERALGLSRVVVFTAGIRGAELVLPGLDAAEAARLRDQLAEMAGGEHAV